MFTGCRQCVALTHLKHVQQKWVKLKHVAVGWVTPQYYTESTEQNDSVSAKLESRLSSNQFCFIFNKYLKSLSVSGPSPPADVGVKDIGNNTSTKNGSVKTHPKLWFCGWVLPACSMVMSTGQSQNPRLAWVGRTGISSLKSSLLLNTTIQQTIHLVMTAYS